MGLRSILTGLATALSLNAAPLLAHSFNVVLVGEDVVGSGAYDGFRLATMEEDSHAGGESDGHLGGLDSNIFTAKPGEALPRDMDIIVMIDSGDVPEITVQKKIEKLELRPTIAWAAIIALDFQRRYLEAYGKEAGPEARRGYFAAQLISRFVRRSVDFEGR